MAHDEPGRQQLTLALNLAARLHQNQVRKGTDIPYLSHLMAVAALVAEDGGSNDAVIAGLLHDAAEDQGGEETLALIREQFGRAVEQIVRDCSDSLLATGEQKAPWRDRKEAAVQRLSTVSLDSLTVIAADKLHNTRATLGDVLISGSGVWQRFKAGREGFVWYHRAVLSQLEERLPGSRSVRLLSYELGQLESTG